MRKHALSVLETPESIYFENITTLKVEDSGPETQGPNLRQGRVSITMNRVEFVDIKTGSFSHWKEKTLAISITNVDYSCVIYSGAIVSSSHNSTVKLANITGGRFFPGTFATTLGRLTLKNVTTSLPCLTNTFGGNIRDLVLTSVTLGGVQTGCFLADQTWGRLVVRSSDLGKIEYRGLRGTIGDVRIERSSFSQIRENGFDLNVTSLTIYTSSIDVLESHALAVQASGTISILRTDISAIHKNALLRLNSSEANDGIILFRLFINEVVNGSLRVSDVKTLTLRELQIRTPCECNIRNQVRQLFFGAKPAITLTKLTKRGPYRHAYDNVRCLHNQTTPSLREYHCLNCRPRLNIICTDTSKNAETDKTSSAYFVSSLIPLAASFGSSPLSRALVASSRDDVRRA